MGLDRDAAPRVSKALGGGWKRRSQRGGGTGRDGDGALPGFLPEVGDDLAETVQRAVGERAGDKETQPNCYLELVRM